MSEEHLTPPLATYREVRFDGKRLFELHADSIRVAGSRTFQSNVDTTIPLSRIDPRVIRMHVRHGSFWAGLCLAVVGFFGYEILTAGFKLNPFEFPAGLPLGLGVTGIALCLATARKVEFARFESDAGVAVLDIARAGPDRAKFDEFVSKLQDQVRSTRGGA